MNHLEAQQEFAQFLKSASDKVKSYFWRLTGNEPNSLCKFLSIEEKELMSILRLCRVFTSENDKFSKNNFELLMNRCDCDWTTYRIKGKPERFVRIGDGDDIILPKDTYSDDMLVCYPEDGDHMNNLRTRTQKGSVPKLLKAASVPQNPHEDASTLESFPAKAELTANANVVTPSSCFILNKKQRLNEETDDHSAATTPADFIAEMKEEVLLQSLLHKRIHGAHHTSTQVALNI